MQDNKRFESDLWRTDFVLVALLIWVLIEASALWRAAQPSVAARWTAAGCAIPAALFCLMGVASVSNIRKQVLPRRSS